jgi:hypothetical protein
MKLIVEENWTTDTLEAQQTYKRHALGSITDIVYSTLPDPA